MKISNRLQALYEAVSPGETVADIGTDHGYVPMMLLRDGITDFVILSDISSGSLAKAIDNFDGSGIPIPNSCFRIGNGLKPIFPGEVDDVIIAGMGGRMIQMILDEDLEKTRTYRKLILQPRNNSGELRCYLYSKGFDIQEEILTKEGKFVCEIIVAAPVPGDSTPLVHSANMPSSDFYREQRALPYDEHDIRWKYPEAFITCNPELLAQRIDWQANRFLEQIESLEQSQISREDRILDLKRQREYILDLKERSRRYHEAAKTGNN